MLHEVLRGIDKALEAGLVPVKLNSVIVKDVNSGREEITSLARLSVTLPVIVRFIEYCPTGNVAGGAGRFVPNGEVRRMIEDEFGPLDGAAPVTGSGPAVYFRIKDSPGAIGFISGMTSTICHGCNRLRLTCDGRLMPCLYSSKRYAVRASVRNRADDGVMVRRLGGIIRGKHNFTGANRDCAAFSMQRIGG
jgi:cyclic pyranopterin phosphate synthase